MNIATSSHSFFFLKLKKILDIQPRKTETHPTIDTSVTTILLKAFKEGQGQAGIVQKAFIQIYLSRELFNLQFLI